MDFWTGKKYEGGREVTADAPIDKIPLFVRQGSIVPMGPVVQHTGELPGKELTIVVYPGRDARFVLYEDEGDNYDYEQGCFSTIELQWNDKRRVLTFGERRGGFEGMEKTRRFRVVVADGTEALGERTDGKLVRYEGKELKCRL